MSHKRNHRPLVKVAAIGGLIAAIGSCHHHRHGGEGGEGGGHRCFLRRKGAAA